MIGDRAITGLRVAGYPVQVVFLDVRAERSGDREAAADMRAELDYGWTPVVVTAGSNPKTSDLRFSHGMNVIVTEFSGEPGLLEWFDAVVAFEPRSVMVVPIDEEAFGWPT